ncbi:MAG TPA: PorV/PorQ family protein [Elusimicrobiota bacterium]|nr:PorV/PorQ family protein [Elusimicrobiota bacterium]
MSRPARAAAALLVLAAARAGATTQGENPGVTAAQVLQIPLGARAMGMGSAFTGVADDVSTLYYNPAGLSNLGYREVSFMHLKGLEDQTLDYFAGASPLPFTGLMGLGYATLGGSILWADQGQIVYNPADSAGNILSTQNLRAGGDFVATLGYSERVASWDYEAGRESYPTDHFLGANVKFIRSTLAQSYSATAVAADAGYFAKVPDLGLAGGLSLSNMGTHMRYTDGGIADPLPLTARLGLSYAPRFLEDLRNPPGQKLVFAGDAQYLYYEHLARGYVGLEYTVYGQECLRLGYQLNNDVGGVTFGFGVGWQRFQFDYAWTASSEFTDTHRFSVSYRFGGVSRRAREAHHRPRIEDFPESGPDRQTLEQAVPQTMDAPPRRPSPEGRPLSPGWIY